MIGMRAVLAIVLAGLAIALVGASTPAEPTIADPELFEKSLDAARQALEYYGEWDDPEAAARVSRLGYELAQYTGFTDYPFQFFVVDIPVPNAFALPGGQIFMTRGMIEQDLDDEQLAGLMGHEIAHVTKSHGVRLQKRATLLNVLSQALVVGAILTQDSERRPADLPADIYGRDRADSANRIQGIAATGMVLSELLLRSHSREFEDESDEEGQRLAAAAGYSPAGTVRLMDTLGIRMPQTKEFGYWQTHPFFEERVKAARARADLMKPSESPRSADAYRQATQQRLLDALENDPAPKDIAVAEPPRSERPGRGPSDGHAERAPLSRREFLEKAALMAWPSGPDAERLRLANLERLAAREEKRPELSRNYGRLAEAWQSQLETVRTLTPESSFIATLEKGIADLERTRAQLYPRAAEVFTADVWETSFLESFLGNWPVAPEAPRVALALGDAHARLRREGDAAESYLTAWRLDREGEAGKLALVGLRRMTPRLGNLSALEKLAEETGDPEVVRLAGARLVTLAGSYDDLAVGAEYLREYPHGSQAAEVEARLSALADRLYGEVMLYQGVGEVVKAASRIADILEYAPFSPAADRLRSRTLSAADG